MSSSKFSDVLEEFASLYKVSKRPQDYIFAVVRAVTADVPNENKDCFGEYELLNLKKDGRFTYETFNGVPLFQEHKDNDITASGGVVIDTFYDDVNPKDKGVIGLLGIDMTKKRKLAAGLANGQVQTFSMGCVCEQSRCSVCNHVASFPSDYCMHVKNKYVLDKVGGKKVFEWCENVTYRELSHVGMPADPQAQSYEACGFDTKGDLVCKEVQ